VTAGADDDNVHVKVIGRIGDETGDLRFSICKLRFEPRNGKPFQASPISRGFARTNVASF
jgi:hypothetical protein